MHLLRVISWANRVSPFIFAQTSPVRKSKMVLLDLNGPIFRPKKEWAQPVHWRLRRTYRCGYLRGFLSIKLISFSLSDFAAPPYPLFHCLLHSITREDLLQVKLLYVHELLEPSATYGLHFHPLSLLSPTRTLHFVVVVFFFFLFFAQILTISIFNRRRPCVSRDGNAWEFVSNLCAFQVFTWQESVAVSDFWWSGLLPASVELRVGLLVLGGFTGSLRLKDLYPVHRWSRLPPLLCLLEFSLLPLLVSMPFTFAYFGFSAFYWTVS